jgi:hypothetical protein
MVSTAKDEINSLKFYAANSLPVIGYNFIIRR